MSISVTPKKRGRPATGRDPHLSLRLPEELLQAVEHHAEAVGETRSEAIRRLIEAGLKAKSRTRGMAGKK
jgi:metal-responsive CopG/Arc/MetJ family transcriptional regulator